MFLWRKKTKFLQTVRLQALYFTQLDLFRILLNDFLRFHKFSVFFLDFVVGGGVFFFAFGSVMDVVLRVIIKWQYVNGNQIAGNSKANKRIKKQTRQAIDSIRLQHQKCSENSSGFFSSFKQWAYFAYYFCLMIKEKLNQ